MRRFIGSGGTVVLEKRGRAVMNTAKRGWAFRLASAGLLAALVLTLTGDRGVYTAVPSGIDPLEVLNLSVRANALVVLDSSGSMRESPLADYSATTVPDTDEGELTGDDPRSKMAQAKAVLRSVIQANESKVSFQFGRYEQATGSYGPDGARTFVYTTDCDTADTTCNSNASNILISNASGGACNNASCNSFLYRVATHRWTENGRNIYSLFTGRFYNGQRFEVRQNGTNGAQIGDTGDTNPPVVHVQTRGNTSPFSLIGAPVTFTYSGIRWNRGNNSTTSCGGFESLVGLSACTDNFQLGVIDPHLEAELKLDPTTGNILDPDYTPVQGIRSSGFTPIAESLIDLKNEFSTGIWPGISGLTPKPRTFVIFVTDGDDSCPTSGGAGDTSSSGAQNRALRAAHKAQQLFTAIGGAGGDPASSVTTFVVAFGSGTARDRADWIAWGGSGMNQNGVTCGGTTGVACNPITGTGAAARWTNVPSTAQLDACPTCRPAFVAATADELTAALQTAIDQGQSAGEFSDQQSITESIFEYAPLGGKDPEEPKQRFETTLPVLLQSTFTMPGFEGHLKAFRNQSETSLQEWDAAQKLLNRLSPAWTGTAVYSQLHGGVATPDAIATSTAFIKRRIYTTTRNGVFVSGTDAQVVNNLTTPRYQPAGQVALWPPDTATVDPTGGAYPAGVFDDELGIMGSATATDTQNFNALVAEFAACTSAVGADLPADCTSTAGNPDLRLRLARREARQIILAHAAGAELVKSGASALRQPVTRLLQFRKRPSLLAESTLSAPAVVTPPSEGVPASHQAEYKLFRDGPRATGDLATNGIANGFGLRNPDLDASTPATGPDTRTALKPVMSVVYHGANDMLHAFRAGPCQTLGTAGTCVGGAVETGGEELWAFVPYDQLGKLRERLKPQAREPHTYMIAAPVRFSDIFVPGNFSRSIGSATAAGGGVWRTVLLFGRGIGGKHLTALDVTVPGAFNVASLSTAPPIALWNRGNPDTQDGTLGGTRNNTLGGSTDYTDYLTMGQTWSVPAIGFVVAADNLTARKPQGVEFVAYAGSGYGTGANAADEGTHIYTLDVLTGDMVAAVEVGDRPGMAFENALVASPAAFNQTLLDITDIARQALATNSASGQTTRVYIGDIHGRVWRVLSDSPGATPPLLFADLGPDQPVANPAALVYYAGTQTMARPHVYVEAGHDNRVAPPPDPTPPFRLYGLRDDDLATDPDAGDGIGGVATVLFAHDLPDGYRGNVQPATAFSNTTPPAARVFFAGTRYNLPGTPNAPPPPPCRSSFDSILFAVGGESGDAAYDLNASGDDRFVEISEQRIQAVRVAGGRLVADMGLGAQTPPPPPAPPVAQPPAPSPLANVMVGAFNPDGTPRIAGLVPIKFGSSVCR